MVEQMHRTLKRLSRWGVVAALGLVMVTYFPPPAWSQPKKRRERNWRSYQRLSPEEKTRLNKKYQRWRSLPPERQRDLRRRMEQWRGLPPEERALYEKRFNQWR